MLLVELVHCRCALIFMSFVCQCLRKRLAHAAHMQTMLSFCIHSIDVACVLCGVCVFNTVGYAYGSGVALLSIVAVSKKLE